MQGQTDTTERSTLPGETRARLRAVLSDVWGYSTFRPLQEQAMAAVLERRDSLVVMPTGGGKSLCFQAPALLREGTAIVISPLISLMRDQVAQLWQAGVRAGSLHSGQPTDERRAVQEGLAVGTLKLLYLSPERIALEDPRTLLGRARLSFVAVDEAHCISMWGHDFRPEYRQIARFRELFPEADMHAYTATATPEVSRDIRRQLALQRPVELRGSFDRPNLFYSAKPRQSGIRRLFEVVRRHAGQSGIVYCITRKETDKVAGALRKEGFKAVPYHAGMEPDERRANQEAFVADSEDIVVATVAFGMGINKPDVRYVVHMGMPKSIENYQQEIGRAGRDGLPSECLLLYSLADLMMWKRIMTDVPPEQSAIAWKKLDRMYEWCSQTGCRRTRLLRHFGEEYPRQNCGMCDQCTGGHTPVPDSHTVAQKILSCAVRLGESHNAVYTTNILSGAKTAEIRGAEHHKLSTWGLLSGRPKECILDWIEQLRGQGLLAAGEGGALSVTEKGWDVLRNRATGVVMDRLRTAAAPPTSSLESLSPTDRETFERLRQLRKQIAAREKVPPYVIFGDVTLRDTARLRPRDLHEFRRIKGVGRRKLEAYGAAFLEALWRDPPPGPDALREIPRTERERRTSERRADKKRLALELFRQGELTAEIAKQIGRAVSTAEQYIVEQLREEGPLDIAPWVPEDLAAAIEEALGATRDGRLRSVFDALEGGATYLQIRLVKACMKSRGE